MQARMLLPAIWYTSMLLPGHHSVMALQSSNHAADVSGTRSTAGPLLGGNLHHQPPCIRAAAMHRFKHNSAEPCQSLTDLYTTWVPEHSMETDRRGHSGKQRRAAVAPLYTLATHLQLKAITCTLSDCMTCLYFQHLTCLFGAGNSDHAATPSPPPASSAPAAPTPPPRQAPSRPARPAPAALPPAVNALSALFSRLPCNPPGLAVTPRTWQPLTHSKASPHILPRLPSHVETPHDSPTTPDASPPAAAAATPAAVARHALSPYHMPTEATNPPSTHRCHPGSGSSSIPRSLSGPSGCPSGMNTCSSPLASREDTCALPLPPPRRLTSLDSTEIPQPNKSPLGVLAKALSPAPTLPP